MKTVTATSSEPVAFISTGRNRLKLYGGKMITPGTQSTYIRRDVYLRDGQEFEIELFNPTQQTVAAKIYINGNSISNTFVVLKPGERSYLERFIDDNKKFKFNTYNVEDSYEAKKAIINNGLVRIEFFREHVQPTVWPSTVTYTYPWFNSTTGTNILGPLGISGVSGVSGPSGSVGIYYSSGNTTSNLDFNAGMVTTTTDASYTANIETGRVEAGGFSNQDFGSYFGSFESWHFASTEYRILPESNKPVEANKIRQYCGSCGIRVRKASWKFCPSCGGKID